MSLTARSPGTYDGSGPQVLLVAVDRPSQAAVVGDRGRLRALIAWARSVGLSHDGLVGLDQDSARLDPVTAARVATQLRRAGQVLRDVPLPAVGWSAPSGTGLLGGVLGVDLGSADGLLVCCDDCARVTAHVDGEGGYLLVASAAASVRVTSWVSRGGLVQVNGAGDPWGTGQVLKRLAPAAVVTVVPATSVVAGLLVTLREVAEHCASTGQVLKVSAGPDADEIEA